MKYKTLLVAGGAGFIGSNLGIAFKRKYPKLKVIALDNLKRRGSEMNISRLKEEDVEFIHADIRVPEDLVLNAKIDLILECSAEPSVLAGFGDNPKYIINTNLSGTVNCLELARRNKADMIFLSTSRVYPYEAINKIKTKKSSDSLVWASGQKIPGWSSQGINEDFTTCGPKTLYGATKLASELLIQEYISNYGLKAVINRCGVVAGPWQFGKVDQGVFTFWMLEHYFKQKLNYIGFGGEGRQVRDLLHVDDLFALIDLQVSNLDKASGEIYNVGGGVNSNLSLRQATDICRTITGNSIAIGKVKEERMGDISIYISDNAKVKREFSWEPCKGPQDILGDIYAWISENEELVKRLNG